MPEWNSGDELQLVAPFAMLPDVLRRLGVDPETVCQAAGLAGDALNDPQGTIPYSAVGRLLEEAAVRTNCPDFGLQAGKHFRTTSLGLVGQLMRNAPTVGIGIRDYVANQHRNAHGSVSYLLEENQRVFWGYASYHVGLRGHHIMCDFAAIAGLTVLCELAGAEHKRTVEVLLSRAEPENPAAYHRAFGTKICFEAEQTALVLPKGFVDLPVAGADHALRAALEKKVATLCHAGALDTLTHLRRVLRVALLNGGLRGDAVAAQLGMSRRSLHRKLAAYGLRFQQVLDQTRCEFARQLLTNTRMPIGEIAMIVGYADPSVLTRRFVQWTGLSPGRWRSNVEAARSLAKLARAIAHA